MPRPLILLLTFSLFTAKVYGDTQGTPSTGPRTLENLLEESSSSTQGTTPPIPATRSPTKPSTDVQRILDKAVAEVKKNRQECDKLNEKPLDEARQELRALAKRLIDEGKAAEATAALECVKTVQADVMRLADDASPSAGGKAQERRLLQRLEGSWAHQHHPHIFVISENGTVKEIQKSGNLVARGTLRALTDNIAELKLDNGYTLRLGMIDEDTLGCRIFQPDGMEAGEGCLKFRLK